MYTSHNYFTVIIIVVSIDVNDLYPFVKHDTHVKTSTRGNCSSQSSTGVNVLCTIGKP